MPDDKTRVPGSITKTADAQNERISGISNVSRTITQMQKTTQREIDETRDEIDYGASPDVTMKQMNGVLSRFGQTITAFTRGIQDVSLSTARATRDAIGEYGKAISQDINFNKQNIVAMALSRTTPLFGYFAAKFMETDVYKKAKDRMAQSISGVFKSVGSSIANIFRGKEKAADEAVPKMQRGGYVEKGGMVEVHPAEVIMPIEKVLERIDDTISVAREMAEIAEKTQIRSLAKMSYFVEAEREKEPVGMVKGFFRALREVHSQYEEPSNVRMLRAVLAIQDTLGATIGTWEQVWTKLLVEHPFFRQAMFTLKTLGGIMSLPLKVAGVFFRRRGSYRAHLSKEANPFTRMSDDIASLYTGTMWRLDNIWNVAKINAQANRDVATFLTGNKYPAIEGIGMGFWSFFGWARSGLRLIAKPFEFLANKSKFTKWLTTDISSPVVSLAETIADKIFTHRARLKTLYGGEYATESGVGIVEAILTEFTKGQQRGTYNPLQITYTPELQEQWEEAAEAMVQTKEGVWESADELNKHNNRERRRGLLGFFGMIGGGIWDIAKMAGGFLGNLFGPSGAIGSALIKLFGAGGPIQMALASPKFWGPVGAAIGGYAIGTWINKNIIEPHITGPWFKKMDDLNKEASKRSSQLASDLIKAARGETATGAEAYQARIAAKAGATVSSQQSSLIGTHLASPAIIQAQRDFIKENAAAYSKYSPEEIEKARTRWHHSLGYTALYRWASQGVNPEEFGRKKEASFLKYLQKVGTPSSPEELAKAISEHEAAIYRAGGVGSDVSYFVRKYGEKAKDWVAEKGKFALNKAGQLVDKASGKIIEAKDLAKMQTSDLLASAQLLKQELKERGIEGLEGMKEMGDKVASQLNQVQTVINQQATNITRVYNSGLNKASDLYDEMKQRVVTGNFH
jgi:hypothetical protein